MQLVVNRREGEKGGRERVTATVAGTNNGDRDHIGNDNRDGSSHNDGQLESREGATMTMTTRTTSTVATAVAIVTDDDDDDEQGRG